MHFTNLPSIILEHILRYSVKFDQRYIRLWKANLKLLAVCQKLRIIGVPLVYKTAYIWDGVDNANGFNCKYSSGYTENTAGITNMGLIKYMNITSVVKHIVINICNTSYVDYILENYDSMFEFQSCNWGNVNSLYLIVLDTLQVQSALSKESKVLKFVQEFRYYIANIKIIRTITYDTNANIVFLCNKMLSAYALQLEYATYNNHLTNPHFDIFLQNSNPTINVCPDTQKHNKTYYIENLRNLFVTHTMLQLVHELPTKLDENKKYYIFSRLKFLTVVISDKSSEYNYTKNYLSYQKYLQFPSLKKMSLSFTSIIDLFEIVRLGYFDFSQVEVLSIYLQRRSTPIFDSSYSEIDINRMSTLTKRMLTHSMPQLRNLKIYCPKLHMQNVPIISNIINHFQNIISHLAISQIFTCPSEPFTSLTFLSVSVTDPYLYKFINQSSETLRILVMEDVPHLFSMDNICTGIVEKCVELPYLQSLQLDYNSESEFPPVEDFIRWCCNDKADLGFQVVCPNLETLTLREASYISIYNIFRYFEKVEFVTSIDIEYSDDVNSNIDQSVLNSSAFAEALGKLGNKILNSMPATHHLIYNTNMVDISNDACFCILNSGYSKQLRFIESDVHVPLNNLCYTSALETARLTVSNKITTETPTLIADSLGDININDYSGMFSWSWFTSDDIDDLKFNNLLKCCIRVYENSDNCQFPLPNPHSDQSLNVKRIYMPYVDSFTFEIYELNRSFLATEIYLGTCSKVILTGPLDALPTRGNINSDILGNLEIMVKSAVSGSGERFYNVTNSWFGHRKPLGACDLILEDIAFDIVPEKMNWQNVEKLEFGYAIKSSVLLQILPSMPKLKCLIIDRLVDDCPKNHNTFGGFVSNSISQLSIEDIEMTIAGNMVGMEMLLTGITSLETVSIGNSGVDIEALAGRYKQKFPHLANITFN